MELILFTSLLHFNRFLTFALLLMSTNLSMNQFIICMMSFQAFAMF
jgi:hypothetical protein